MQVDVLGSAGSRPGRGLACSGYVVRAGDTRVLVDCGFGVAVALTAVMDPQDLDAIVVTHRHLDHCVDLLGIYAILRRTDLSIPVHAAPEVAETVRSMVTPHREPEFDAALPMSVLDAGDRVVVGDLVIEALASDHNVPTVSLRITDGKGAVLAYSSDSGGGADLAACAAGADLFLAEASWQEHDEHRGDGHMTALQAATVASSAGVASLVLTHLRPHLDPATSVAEAAAAYGGPIRVARPGMVLSVPPATGRDSSRLGDAGDAVDAVGDHGSAVVG